MVDVHKTLRFALAFEDASGVAPANVDQIISGLWDGSPPGASPVQPQPAVSTLKPSGKKSGFSVPGYTRARTADKFLQGKSQQLLPEVSRLPHGQGIPFTDPRTGQQYLAVHEEHPPRPGGRQDYHSGVSLFVPTSPVSSMGPRQGELSERSKGKISKLYGPFQAQVTQLMLQGLAQGLRPEIVEGFRSQDRQNELYEQGRTTPGKIVTQTRNSMHTQGKAVDIAQLDENGNITYQATPGFWDRMGAIGKSLGMNWGGDWKKFTDRPHFQWKAS